VLAQSFQGIDSADAIPHPKGTFDRPLAAKMDFVFNTFGDAVLAAGFDGVATAASAMFRRDHRMQLLPVTTKNEKTAKMRVKGEV